MVAYNKFSQFTKDLIDGVHDFDAHTFKVMLTNIAPIAGNTVKANLTEISAGFGYTAGGATTTAATSTAAGVAKVMFSDVVFSASGGSIGPFRYVVVYNDTPTSPAYPLIAWFDYGASITTLTTESFTVDFDGTAGLLTIGP